MRGGSNGRQRSGHRWRHDRGPLQPSRLLKPGCPRQHGRDLDIGDARCGSRRRHTKTPRPHATEHASWRRCAWRSVRLQPRLRDCSRETRVLRSAETIRGRNNCGSRRSDRAESGRIAPRRERGPQSPIVRRLTACGSGRIRCPADGKIGILRTAQAAGEISQFERPIAGVALRGNVCTRGRRAPPMIVIAAGEFLAFGHRGHRRMAA